MQQGGDVKNLYAKPFIELDLKGIGLKVKTVILKPIFIFSSSKLNYLPLKFCLSLLCYNFIEIFKSCFFMREPLFGRFSKEVSVFILEFRVNVRHNSHISIHVIQPYKKPYINTLTAERQDRSPCMFPFNTRRSR